MTDSSSTPILRAYVDETGDRGMGPRSSRFFAFACVLIADEDEPSLRAAMTQLRNDFRIPTGDPLHWNRHVKEFGKREHVATVLSNVPNVKIVYVIVEKAAIPPLSGMGRNHLLFYNFAAGIVLERVLLEARDFPGGARDVIAKFAHVKGFDHSSTTDYLNLRIQTPDPFRVPWNLLRTPVTFVGTSVWDGLQAADQYAGMLSVAICPNPYGRYEQHHLEKIVPQIRHVAGKRMNYGFKILSTLVTIQTLPWWAQVGI